VVAPGIESGTSESVARNSDHYILIIEELTNESLFYTHCILCGTNSTTEFQVRFFTESFPFGIHKNHLLHCVASRTDVRQYEQCPSIPSSNMNYMISKEKLANISCSARTFVY
jgi:hypothetical protein